MLGNFYHTTRLLYDETTHLLRDNNGQCVHFCFVFRVSFMYIWGKNKRNKPNNLVIWSCSSLAKSIFLMLHPSFQSVESWSRYRIPKRRHGCWSGRPRRENKNTIHGAPGSGITTPYGVTPDAWCTIIITTCLHPSLSCLYFLLWLKRIRKTFKRKFVT